MDVRKKQMYIIFYEITVPECFCVRLFVCISLSLSPSIPSTVCKPITLMVTKKINNLITTIVIPSLTTRLSLSIGL